ncbi:MAG: TRAP transporter small permease [Bacillota bacterium]
MDKVVRNLLKASEGLLNYTTIVATIVMVVLVFINVLLRYVFKFAITWSEELAVNLFVWVIFMGAILAAINKMHISVDLFTKLMPKKVQKILLIVSNGLVLYALYILADGGQKIAKITHKTISAATGIPFSYVVISVVISGFVMALVVLYHTYLTVCSLVKGEE